MLILHFSFILMEKQSSVHFTKGKQRTVIITAASLNAIESLMILFYFNFTFKAPVLAACLKPSSLSRFRRGSIILAWEQWT